VHFYFKNSFCNSLTDQSRLFCQNNSLLLDSHVLLICWNTEFCFITRIPSSIWSRLYGWLLWMCVLRIGSFPSALNRWSKVWPWILIWAYLIWNFAPIFGQQISSLDSPYIGLFGPSWSELLPCGWIWMGVEGVD